MIEAVKHNKSVAVFLLLLLGISISAEVWKAQTNNLIIETTRDAGFVLSDLRINGLKRTRHDSILAVLDVDDGMPLLSVDLLALQKRIEALPWVKRADVSRVLPGGLNINITECKPFALLQSDGKVVLVDPDGMVITDRNLAEFSDFPLLVGSLSPADLRHFEGLMTAAADVAVRVKSAVRVGDRRWDLIFDNGIRVKLPEDITRGYDASVAWEKFINLNKEYKLLAREISVVDMRTPDRLTLRITPEGQRQMAGKERVL
ncbi:cell division protein FtsQ/DivIB [Kordiimonas aquimaris]|uniref:cell division protein FtsQ/DivIB n=1 Tax=Kordiimonas aquimaris TaxID=707591 RepID=UPI0021D135DC|nr:FtsQ-type POTRA domain-containing protein [Kordiimonas aquimaris]